MFLLFPVLYLLSIANRDDFDAELRSFHSTVDYATAMVGHANACSDPLLDGSEYDTVCLIMKALADPNPDEFVEIFRHLFWDDEASIDGRRLSWASFWQKTGNAFKCAGTAIGAGLTCVNPTLVIVNVMPCNVGPCAKMVNYTKSNC